MNLNMANAENGKERLGFVMWIWEVLSFVEFFDIVSIVLMIYHPPSNRINCGLINSTFRTSFENLNYLSFLCQLNAIWMSEN